MSIRSRCLTSFTLAKQKIKNLLRPAPNNSGPREGRNLIMTAGDAVGRVMLEQTMDLMQAYALRIGADFKLLQTENHTKYSLPRPHAVKFYCGLELKHYDRVFWIDADCLVSPRCPDIFSHVPSQYSFAAWCDEPRAFDPDEEISRPAYRHGYFNSGVLLASDPRPFARGLQILQNSDTLLNDHEKQIIMGEQTPFNKAVHDLNIPVFPLAPEWNFLLHPVTRARLGIQTPLENAYIVHCAGSSHLEVADPRCRQSRSVGLKSLREKLGW